MDISKAADAVVQTEYVCEELSTKRFEAYFVGISAKKKQKEGKVLF